MFRRGLVLNLVYNICCVVFPYKLIGHWRTPENNRVNTSATYPTIMWLVLDYLPNIRRWDIKLMSKHPLNYKLVSFLLIRIVLFNFLAVVDWSKFKFLDEIIIVFFLFLNLLQRWQVLEINGMLRLDHLEFAFILCDHALQQLSWKPRIAREMNASQLMCICYSFNNWLELFFNQATIWNIYVQHMPAFL